MSQQFDNNRAIYLQIVEQLKLDIISKKYVAGDKLPSIRELASHLKVNPNTMLRAFAQLEMEGLIYTERTNGKFISNDIDQLEQFRQVFALAKTREYLKFMQILNLDRKEMLSLIEKAGKEENK